MIVFKMGGQVLERSLLPQPPLTGWQNLPEPWVLVHGGGAMINRTAEALGVVSHFVGGQRVTSPEMLDVVEMVLRGHMNPRLVRSLGAAGVSTWGLSASDNGLLNCRLEDPQLGLVGRVDSVDSAPLELLLSRGYVPVVAPIGACDESPLGIVNVNADVAAAAVATALQARLLVFFTDRDGILDRAGRTRPRLRSHDLLGLRDSAEVYGGMLIKSQAVLDYLAATEKRGGEGQVLVVNGLKPLDLAQFLTSGDFIGPGTLISA